MQALDNVRVLDLTQHIAGPYATRLLADYGADVIKVEPPWGDIARTLPPFQGDEPHPERSGLYFALNTNKRSVVLDLRTAEGRAHLARLARSADLVIESFAPGTLDRLGCGPAFFRSLKPELPVISVSNFGQDGPYRDFKLTELVLYGFAGEMYSIGQTEREPVKMAGTAALFESGSAIATASMAAISAARRFGIGQHVDISLAETHFGGVDRRHATAIAYQFSGRKTLRAAGAAGGMPSGVYPCADGWVDFTAAGSPLRAARIARMIGEEWAADPRWLDRAVRLNPETIDEWNAHFIVWCLARTKREIWAAAREAKVMCGPLFTMEDLFADEHFRGRNFWQKVSHPVMGEVEIPGRPFILPRGGWQLRRPAPLLGQHTDEVLAEVEGDKPRPSESSPSFNSHRSSFPAVHAPTRRNPRPLEGVRVVDLCVVWAGPYATVLLGDLGAEVIKVENPFVWQPGTRGGIAHPPQMMLDAANAWGGGYPGNVPGKRPWNVSPTFVSNFRNKQSFTTNLLTPEGMDVFRRLVATADVVYENNATDVMDRLGITYDMLRAIRPDIILVRAPAYGSSGPYHNARALGVHLEGVMGHSALRGYEDGDPSQSTAIYSGDYLAGTQGAFAVMTALWHRARTGEGQLIELAQAENASAMFTQAIMDYSLNRRVQTAIGNRDVFGRFPCNVYPARSPGTAETMDDHWVSIHCQTDAEWQALKNVMGNPPWAHERRFDTNDGRSTHRADLDAGVAAWTRELDDYDIMHRCQAAGVPAAPVLEASRMFDDPHLRARDFFRKQTIPDAGTHEYVGPLWRFPETPVEYYQPPVTFGEHNDQVYRSLLGYSDDEIEAFRTAGHIATEYDASVP